MNKYKKNNDIDEYIESQEVVANRYVMKCFTVSILILGLALFFNLLDIFIIERSLMWKAFISALIIYIVVFCVTRFVPLSNKKIKYFLLFGLVAFITCVGIFITYHVALACILPLLYAAFYSSKKTMWYVYGLTVVSTIIVVYGGFFWGLCDANMMLLTAKESAAYVINGEFVLNTINSNPYITLMLYFILPRCLIYVAFLIVCRELLDIVSGSVEKAKLTHELEKAKGDAEKAREDAEKANRAKTEFLAKMSHEIRTPINGILGMNEMILCESSDTDIQEYASDVKESSMVLLSVVNEILDSSKIESGKMELVEERYSIGSLLNNIFNMISIKAKEKGLELIFDIDHSIPSEYMGDEKRIRQVLLNLLSNAVKYTEKGTVILSVKGSVAGDVAEIEYSVKDTGIGIRDDDIGKIFEEYRRFDLSKNRNKEGTGLGMSIAQRLLHLMGSEMEIESEYGRGSVFSFKLKQKVMNESALGDFREKFRRASKIQTHRIPFIAPEAKILVVDDYNMNLKVFRNLLKKTQIKIVEAERGAECLRLLERHKFDMVFLDHMMPEMDGVETLQKIRQKGLCEGVPIIMLTANAIVGDREKYIGMGFDDFLSKPIMPDKLDKMILKHLSTELVKQEEFNSLQESHEEKTEPEKRICRESDEQVCITIDELAKRFPELDIELGMKSCSGDVDFYLELYKDFCELPIKNKLNGFLEQLDYKNYNICIHGFKNTAYSIGAKVIGDIAYEMEKMSREGLPDEIRDLQRQLFESYDRVTAVGLD